MAVKATKRKPASNLQTESGNPIAYVEELAAPKFLAQTCDTGERRYYFCLHVTGLHDRVFGPYTSQDAAIAGYEYVLQHVLEAYCEIQSGLLSTPGESVREYIMLPSNLHPLESRGLS